MLDAPDNLVVVPSTGDVFLQEDGSGTQYVRGVTPKGLIYDFARTILNRAARVWRDEGKPWLSTSPLIEMLDEKAQARPPRARPSRADTRSSGSVNLGLTRPLRSQQSKAGAEQ